MMEGRDFGSLKTVVASTVSAEGAYTATSCRMVSGLAVLRKASARQAFGVGM